MVHPLVALVGAELEENLSLRYLAGTLEASGFSTSVIPFNHERHSDRAVQHVLATHPIAVGISVPFQLRARELPVSACGTGLGSSRSRALSLE
ncbi:MAG: hypothetical protein P8X82_04890 [Gemmatimonadales bacterium]